MRPGLFEQFNYFDNLIQVDALDRAHDVRFVALREIHTYQTGSCYNSAKTHVALVAIVLRGHAMFGDEGRRDFALVFQSSWGCSGITKKGRFGIK
jgi:hypothetical protein